MKVCYERELPGGYYITMTPGVWLDECNTTPSACRQNNMPALAMSWVLTQPGLRLEFEPKERAVATLALPGGDMQRQRLQDKMADRQKLLLLEQPILALTGHLKGWKIIRINIRRDGDVQVQFFDVLSSQSIELSLVDINAGKAPHFSVDAMGENGMTHYRYCGLVDGNPQIWEKSAVHERTVAVISLDKCKVEEIVVVREA